MNRRDFLKSLVALPGLAFLKPQVPKGEFERLQAELVERIKASDLKNAILNHSALEDHQAMQALLDRPVIRYAEDGSIHVSGGEWARWDGKTWEPLGES